MTGSATLNSADEVLSEWGIESDSVFHVYPRFGREHVTNGIRCWCQPQCERVEEKGELVGVVIVHEPEQ